MAEHRIIELLIGLVDQQLSTERDMGAANELAEARQWCEDYAQTVDRPEVFGVDDVSAEIDFGMTAREKFDAVYGA